MTREQFIQALADIDIEITDYQLKQFEKYYELLIEWNSKINLTAITQEDEVYEKHFYDSLLVAKSFRFSNQKICDVGAGAGFPSIPLKIIYPEIELVIVDSLTKRIKFLDILAKELELTNFEAVSARAEDYAKENREQFDLVLGRAVARLNILDELCIPLVKVNGYFIALKGKQGLEELEEAIKGIEKLGAVLRGKEKYQLLSDDSVRYILKFEKVKKTDNKYPRNFGQIKKKPL